ncbi:MAG: hypothetical protein GY947_21670, partial [Rhodobacteraceae bacterium]|nr:hypothetical protein [Paracoccaceae bacterium]
SRHADLAVEYPVPVVKALSFNDKPLALYEGTLRLKATITNSEDAETAPLAKLTLQACSVDICLQPEDLVFVLW